MLKVLAVSLFLLITCGWHLKTWHHQKIHKPKPKHTHKTDENKQTKPTKTTKSILATALSLLWLHDPKQAETGLKKILSMFRINSYSVLLHLTEQETNQNPCMACKINALLKKIKGRQKSKQLYLFFLNLSFNFYAARLLWFFFFFPNQADLIQ